MDWEDIAKKLSDVGGKCLTAQWNLFRYLINFGAKMVKPTLEDFLPSQAAKATAFCVGVLFAVLISLLLINFITGLVGQLFKVILYPIIFLIIVAFCITFYEKCQNGGHTEAPFN